MKNGNCAKRTAELVEKAVANLDTQGMKLLPLQVMIQYMTECWEEGCRRDAIKANSGRALKEAACRWAKECGPYYHPRLAQTQVPKPSDEADMPTVVRAPLPAQSAESWQAEADAWRSQQVAKKPGSPNGAGSAGTTSIN